MRTWLPLVLAPAIASLSSAADAEKPKTDVWAIAARNAEQAHAAFARSSRLVHAWYKHKGTNSQLLPQNLRSRVWNAHNSAADLWSFFVITAYLTDPKALDTFVRQTLCDEIRLTTRLGRLPDDYDIDKNIFVRKEPALPSILFGASEYVKDGLLPIVETMGRTVWFDRGRELIEDICANAPVETRFGKIPSESAELNGNMLQSLSRYFAATADPRYKAWAERIGDAYFLEMLPRNNGLPCHVWDFAAAKPRSSVLSLCDHGNEIIFGLSELVVLEHFHDKAKAEQYIPAMRKMLDKLLAVAVNEDGLWVHAIDSTTGKVTNPATPDTWGYALDAVYAFYMVTGEAKYRDAVHRALKGINAKPQYRQWGGADAFADSIESGIVLLNRIPEPQGFEWLEATVPAFLAKQREDGIVEGWHGDGNYARTALMYALMKTGGTRVSDWRPGLKFGAAVHDGKLYLQLSADKPWQGTLLFDYPRHRHHFGLALNYPRLNEFPEWYPLEPARSYLVAINGGKATRRPGYELIHGLSLSVADKPVQIVVEPVQGPLPEPTAIPTYPPIEAMQIQPNAGVLPSPQAADLKVEASVEGQRLSVRLVSAKPWEGKLQFDFPRGLLWLGRRLTRPPEWRAEPWYAIESTRLYQVTVDGKALEPILGDDLLRGLPAKADGKGTAIVVEPLPGPPYGGRALRIEAPLAIAGDGPVRLRILVCNETGEPRHVKLATSFGRIEPAEAKLEIGGTLEAALLGDLKENGEAKIELATADGRFAATHTLRLIHDKTLVGFLAFDDEEYGGRRYRWCGRGPIEFTLPARNGQPHTLHLLWGAKGDQRSAVVTVNGHPHKVAQGGYTGYKWVTVSIDAKDLPADAALIRIESDPAAGRAAFISEAKLTSP